MMSNMRETRFRWFVSALTLSILSVSYAQGPQRSALHKEELIPVAKRTVAPDFTLTDLSGKEIALSKYKRHVLLLDFWATTCGGCKVELPWYVDFDKKYRGKGLSVLGLDMYGETAEVIKPFAAKWHMNYPLAIGTDAIGDRFGLKEMPLTVLIDRGGRIAVSHVGIVDRDSFENDVLLLLKE